MSVLAHLAHPASELLLRRLVSAHDVRGLLIADRNGLPLVSTFATGGFEEALAAFAGGLASQVAFANAELHLGGLTYQHLMGRDRQFFFVPLSTDEVLIAVTDVTAVTANVVAMLLGTAVEMMNLVLAKHAEVAEES